jgi:phosphatidate cytidylyltransferase
LAASPSRVSPLTRRLASVAVLIPLIVAVTWWYWATAAFVAACVAVAIVELFDLLRAGGHAPRRGPGVATGLLLCAAAALQPFTPLDLTALGLTLAVAGTLSYEVMRRERGTSLLSWALTLTGAAYIGWLLSAFILLRQLDTPLRPGPLSALGIPPGTAWVILGLPVSYGAAALIGAATGVTGPLGDLGESLIKRQIGVKDSGALIPGHGGILDRMDSLLFTAPTVYYGVLLTLGI